MDETKTPEEIWKKHLALWEENDKGLDVSVYNAMIEYASQLQHPTKQGVTDEKKKLTIDMENFMTGILNEVWVHNVNPTQAFEEICELLNIEGAPFE